MSVAMIDEHDYHAPSPPTAEDLRRRTKSGNRMVMWLLVAVSLIFLAGAFGVAMLVVYGPY
jgi:hypothetical protein